MIRPALVDIREAPDCQTDAAGGHPVSSDELLVKARTLIYDDADEQLVTLQFFLDYCCRDFLPAPVIVTLQAVLFGIFQAPEIPEQIVDQVYGMISLLADFLDEKTDFSDVVYHLLADAARPSAYVALLSLLNGQPGAAASCLPQLQESFSQDFWTQNQILQLLVALSHHLGIIPELLGYVDVVIEFAQDPDLDLATDAIQLLRCMAKRQIGRQALFSHPRAGNVFRFQPELENEVLKLVLVLLSHDAQQTLNLFESGGLFNGFLTSLHAGVEGCGWLALETCSSFCDEPDGAAVLAESGLLGAIQATSTDLSFTTWVVAFRVLCAAICHGAAEIIDRLEIGRFVEFLVLVLSLGRKDDEMLVLSALQTTVLAMDARGEDPAKAIGTDKLIEALWAVKGVASMPIARFVIDRLT
jgi:hypothetical protein